jgi:hypothetical protein
MGSRSGPLDLALELSVLADVGCSSVRLASARQILEAAPRRSSKSAARPSADRSKKLIWSRLVVSRDGDPVRRPVSASKLCVSICVEVSVAANAIRVPSPRGPCDPDNDEPTADLDPRHDLASAISRQQPVISRVCKLEIVGDTGPRSRVGREHPNDSESS